MASDKPLFADSWYQPPRVTELRQEIQNLYQIAKDEISTYFSAAGTWEYVAHRSCQIDIEDAEVSGGGTATYEKNGISITESTSFVRGDVLSITAAASEAVTIPMFYLGDT